MTEMYEPDVSLGFIFMVLIALFLFFRSIITLTPRQAILTGIIILLWIILQGLLAGGDFYKNFSVSFPRIVYGVFPAVFAAVLFAFFLPASGLFSLQRLTFFHSIRLLAGLILLSLYYDKQIPVEMTFAGMSFDILAGITAPLMCLSWFQQSNNGLKVLLVWNMAALLLLLHIVVTAFLSFPTDFQVFGRAQPNVAMTYFPFIWLPVLIVPMIVFAHLYSIRKILYLLKVKSR